MRKMDTPIRNCLHLSIAVCVFVWLVGCTDHVRDDALKTTNTPGPDEIYVVDGKGLVNMAGWDIPEIRMMRIVESGKVDQMAQDSSRIEVEFTAYLPDAEMIVDSPRGVMQQTDEQKMKVKRVVSLSHEGKVYAYNPIAFSIEKDNSGKISEVGPGLTYRFFDEDGDGRYELNCYSSYLGRVPAWAGG